MLVNDFDFLLPGDLIAQDAIPRGESRLLVLDRAAGGMQHLTIADLPRLLRAGDLLVVNNTRVFAARLLGHRVPSGGAVECLLLAPREPVEPLEPPRLRADEHSALRRGLAEACRPDVPDKRRRAEPPEPVETPEPAESIWLALMHPGQKLKPGSLVKFEGDAGVLMGEVLAQHFQGRRTIRLWSETGRGVTALVDALGHVPLPPYIHRADTPADRERYQTMFARVRGSVAAPTAGLHFTPELLKDLASRGIEHAEITLHVGYGTFKPVKVDRVEDHLVDPEPYSIPADAADRIARARAEGRRVIAVGTTTTRALEDAAQRGDGRVRPGPSRAELFIYPGREFRVVSGLVTNFHLPKSSLLMLVSAFAGTELVLNAYREAIARRYRFYSYGDAMLIV